MDLKALRAEVGKWEETVQALQQSRANSGQKIAALDNERKQHVLPARAAGDKAAQQQLQRIHDEIAVIQRSDRDDSEALAEACQKLASLKAALALAEKQAQREEVRAALQSRAKGDRERRIVKLMEQLEKEFEGFVADNDQLAAKVRAFHPRLAAAAQSLTELTVPARVYVPLQRFEGLEAIPNWLARTTGHFQCLLRSLDNLPLDGEVRTGDWRLFEAQSNVGCEGLMLAPGQKIWVRPGEVDYLKGLLSAGALKECEQASEPAVSVT